MPLVDLCASAVVVVLGLIGNIWLLAMAGDSKDGEEAFNARLVLGIEFVIALAWLLARLRVRQLSQWEEMLAQQLRYCLPSAPQPVREYHFSTSRKWRFDFAWPAEQLAVEVEGGVWLGGGGHYNRGRGAGGGHQRGAGFTRNLEKYNTAALDGWVVLRFTDREIRSGEAVKIIDKALQLRRRARKGA